MITILINGVRTLSPNGGGHWRARHPFVKAAREAAYAATRDELRRAGFALGKLHSAGRLRGSVSFVDARGRAYPVQRVTITRCAPSDGLDRDNLGAALKPVQDGVARALGVDDRDARETVRPGPVEWERGQERGPWGVKILIEP